MVHPDDMRLHQEPHTRIRNQPVVGGKKWEAGYVYDAFSATSLNKPAPYRHWNEFPVTDPPTTNECGDLHMHEETDSYGWALCKDDEIRLGLSIHKDSEMKDSEVVTIWQGLLDDLGPLVDCLGQQGICSPSIVVCIYLNTCTPGQLGKMWALMRKVRQWSPETQATFQPSGLLDELQKEFRDEKFNERKSCIAKTLDRFNKYILSMCTL